MNTVSPASALRRLAALTAAAVSCVLLAAAISPATPAVAQPMGMGPLQPFLPIADPPVVRAIEVDGLQRIDRAGVRGRIYSQIGRELDQGRLSEDIKRIYALNFFEDIQIAMRPHPDGGVILTFRVTERPTIVAIDLDLDGDAVDKEDIQKVVDLKKFDILDESRVRFNLGKIEELYTEEGFFLVESSYRLSKRANNGIAVTLVIREGRKVEVKDIHIVGNDRILSDELTGMMATRSGSYFSFLTDSGQFKRELFERDLSMIQYFYLTKGYVQVQVGEPIITLSPDKRFMSITLQVNEGPRYKAGAITFEMEDDVDWLISKEELEGKIALMEGQWFDYGMMQQDTQMLSSLFKDRGFANANVGTDHDLDTDALTFDVTYKINKGEPVYIRRVEVRGNRTTRDKVIRREMKIAEGELYSGRKIRHSQQRIQVLGYFEGVDIETRQTAQPDMVDLVVKVKEKQTGTFQIGAGFSSLESFILTAQISKDNFLGRGQNLSAQLTLSGIRQLFSISFFEPYFFDSKFTFAFDIFNFQEAFTDFTRLRTGGNMSWGYRLTDDLSVSLTYTLEDVSATLRTTNIDVKTLRQQGLTSSMRLSASFDTRNNRAFATKGQYSTFSTELATKFLGSENEFLRMIGRTRWYFPLFWEFVLRLNGTVGWVYSLNDKPVPLFERFFVGGIFTVRGFQRNTIGDQLWLTSNPDGVLSPINIGGTKELILNAEIEFPIFAQMQIRGVVFFDAGNAWGLGSQFNPLDLRTALGFGLRWNSPVGPLRFEWGFPLAPRIGEKPMVFEFTIGNSF